MIERKDIERLSELSRMKLSEEEMEGMRKDMGAILDYVSQLKEVTSTDQSPTSGLNRNVFREDNTPHESGVYTEELLKEAPSREGNYVKVKKILGGSDVS